MAVIQLKHAAADKPVTRPEVMQISRDGGDDIGSRMTAHLSQQRYIAGRGAVGLALVEAAKLVGKPLPVKVRKLALRVAYAQERRREALQFKAVSHNNKQAHNKAQRSADVDTFIEAFESGNDPVMTVSSFDKIMADLENADRAVTALNDIIIKSSNELLDAYAASTWHAKHLKGFYEAEMSWDSDADAVTNKQRKEHEALQEQMRATFLPVILAYEDEVNGGVMDGEIKQLRTDLLDGSKTLPTLTDIRDKTYSQRGLTIHPGAEGLETARTEKAEAERTEQEGIAADSAKARNLTPGAVEAAKTRAAKRMQSTSVTALEGSPEDK